MICPDCQRQMRIASLIDEREVIEKMLKCLGLREQDVRGEPNHRLSDCGGRILNLPIEV